MVGSICSRNTWIIIVQNRKTEEVQHFTLGVMLHGNEAAGKMILYGTPCFYRERDAFSIKLKGRIQDQFEKTGNVRPVESYLNAHKRSSDISSSGVSFPHTQTHTHMKIRTVTSSSTYSIMLFLSFTTLCKYTKQPHG